MEKRNSGQPHTGKWRESWRKTLCAARKDVIVLFLLSLVMVQGMYAIGSLNFDSILPWLFLLFFMRCLWNVSGYSKGMLTTGAGFAVLSGFLFFLREGAGGLRSFYCIAVVAGGFLTGVVLGDLGKKWFLAKNVLIKALSVAPCMLVTGGLLQEGFLSAGAGFSRIPFLIAVVFIYLNSHAVLELIQKRRRPEPYSLAGALLFGLFSSVGNLSVFENHGWSGFGVSFFCWFWLFYICLEYCRGLEERLTFFQKEKAFARPWAAAGVFFLITVIGDLIYLLAYFPGVMEYDSYIQMCQVYGEPYSNHHPWLHTMLIKGIYELGRTVLNSTNRGFALYSLFSICILSLSFACVVYYLCKKGLKKQYTVALGLLYALSPINQMYSIIMWKDIPFAVCVILFTVLLCQMRDNLAEGKRNRLLWILFVPLSFCVCFFRTNGLYVFLVMLPFILWVFRKQRKEAFAAAAAVLCLIVLYKGPVMRHFEVAEPDAIEALSIPAQQMAAVIAYDGVITQKQRDILENIVDLDRVGQAHLGSVHCSDDVKNLVREKDNQAYITENAGLLFRTWLELFWQNKGIYVKAFVDETEGYWYHKINYHFIWATYIQDNGMGIDRDVKLPQSWADGIADYLKAYKAHFDQYQSIGLYVYLFFLCLFTALRKKSRYLLVYLPVLGIWGTLLIATPVYADLRYAYAIYVSVPLLIGVTALKPENEVCSVPRDGSGDFQGGRIRRGKVR